MGIDPQTHEQYSDPNGLLRRPATSPSARHLAQWESARLEAEARLSRESQFLVPSSVGRSETDYFLRIWNSEIGESFRKFKKGEKNACQSPTSQASTCTKYGSASGITTEFELGVAGSPVTGSNQHEYKEWKIGQPYTEDFLQGSDTSSSNAMEDSSESALQLLLDFPSNNDMSFLGHSDSYSLYPFLSESSWSALHQNMQCASFSDISSSETSIFKKILLVIFVAPAVERTHILTLLYINVILIGLSQFHQRKRQMQFPSIFCNSNSTIMHDIF